MRGTVLSVASRAVLEACESLGLEADALLQAAGARRDEVFDPDARLPAQTADAIWLAARAATDDPDLALRAAAALPFGAYKVLDFVVANAPTVGAALARLGRYFAVVDQRGELQLHEGDPGRLVFRSTQGPLPPAAQQYTLAAIVTRLRHCAGRDVPLIAIQLTFPRPQDLTTYEAVFGCPLRFDCQDAALVLARETVEAPIDAANGALLSVLDDHAERLLRELPPLPDDFLARVRAAIASQLRGGEVAAAHVARQLGVSERTLQRRLGEAGHGYSELLTEARRGCAEGYLRDGGIALCEIAWLLGFSDQSAFTRAFKRWTGHSPGAWRAAQAWRASEPGAQ